METGGHAADGAGDEDGSARPHRLAIVMPKNEFYSATRTFELAVDLHKDTLQDCTEMVRDLPFISVPASYQALYTHPKTSKPLLMADTELVHHGLRDLDELRLFFFPSSWPGFERMRQGEFVEAWTNDVV